MLLLAIGDLHIPDRCTDVPEKFKKLLSPGKISQVVCLGNATDKSTFDYLKTIAPNFVNVKGEFDTLDHSWPLTQIVNQGQLKIGAVAGHSVIPNADPDALLVTARQLDVDVLIWGGTHRVEAYELEGKFFINPGSATGAFYTGWEENDDHHEDPTPSFCLLDIQGSVCVLYIYTLVDGEVKVDRISYKKE